MAIVRDDQNLYDVTLQEFGTLEELFVVIDDNNIDVNKRVAAGQDLITNNENVGDESVKGFYKLNAIFPNNNQGTGLPPQIAGDFNNDFNNDFR